jgi:hypothetical protein
MGEGIDLGDLVLPKARRRPRSRYRAPQRTSDTFTAPTARAAWVTRKDGLDVDGQERFARLVGMIDNLAGRVELDGFLAVLPGPDHRPGSAPASGADPHLRGRP